MPNVEIYTKSFCGYCRRAKSLLTAHGVGFTEIDVSWDPAGETAMIERSGGAYTVPQIFIDGCHIGDSDRLASLDAAGQLAPLLTEAAPAGEE